jgi:hypothetical protein
MGRGGRGEGRWSLGVKFLQEGVVMVFLILGLSDEATCSFGTLDNKSFVALWRFCDLASNPL